MTRHESQTMPLTHGDVILRRLSTRRQPVSLRPFVTTFAREQAAYERACAAVQTTKRAYRQTLASLACAGRALDAAIYALADVLVGARLGSRQRPFAAYIAPSPSRLVEAAYVDKVAHVRALVGALATAPTTPALTDARASCTKAAAEVEAWLAALTLPKQAYAQALRTRAERLAAWRTALTRLKIHARASLMDDDIFLSTLFAKPDALQAPVRKRTSKPVVVAEKTRRAGGPKVNRATTYPRRGVRPETDAVTERVSADTALCFAGLGEPGRNSRPPPVVGHPATPRSKERPDPYTPPDASFATRSRPPVHRRDCARHSRRARLVGARLRCADRLPSPAAGTSCRDG